MRTSQNSVGIIPRLKIILNEIFPIYLTISAEVTPVRRLPALGIKLWFSWGAGCCPWNLKNLNLKFSLFYYNCQLKCRFKKQNIFQCLPSYRLYRLEYQLFLIPQPPKVNKLKWIKLVVGWRHFMSQVI